MGSKISLMTARLPELSHDAELIRATGEAAPMRFPDHFTPSAGLAAGALS